MKETLVTDQKRPGHGFTTAAVMVAIIVVTAVMVWILRHLMYVVPFLLGTGMDMPDPNRPGRMTSAYSPSYVYALEFLGLCLCIAVIVWLLKALRKKP